MKNHQPSTHTGRRDFLKISAAAVATTGLAMSLNPGDVQAKTAYFRPTETVGDPFKVNEGKISVVLLGTGSPQSSHHRAKSSQAFLADNQVFLVDCGAGAVHRMLEVGINPGAIYHLFFTHHHHDHNAGFIDLFLTGWISALGGRKQPLNVYGPPGTAEIIGYMRQSVEHDVRLRTRHVGQGGGNAGHFPDGAVVNFHEMTEGVIFENGSTKVSVFPVDHRPVENAVGYRFESSSKRVVFSGDTLPVDNMIRYSRNADLLVHECYSKAFMEKAIQKYPQMKNEIHQVMTYHTSTIEAAEIAEKAEVKQLALTHLMPSPSQVFYFEKFFIKGMSDAYHGKISVGRDLMSFEL